MQETGSTIFRHYPRRLECLTIYRCKYRFWSGLGLEPSTSRTVVRRSNNWANRSVDVNSHHQKRHKINTALTLLNLAVNLPRTSEGKSKALIHVKNALKSNSYPRSIIANILKKKPLEITKSPKEFSGCPWNGLMYKTCTVYQWVIYISIYQWGFTPLTILLKNNGIQATSEFIFPKSRMPDGRPTNVAYKIACADCPWDWRVFTNKKKWIKIKNSIN